MTRKYSVVIESGPTGYSGYVLEVPVILVTGNSADELLARAAEAIRVYGEELGADQPETAEILELEIEFRA